MCASCVEMKSKKQPQLRSHFFDLEMAMELVCTVVTPEIPEAQECRCPFEGLSYLDVMPVAHSLPIEIQQGFIKDQFSRLAEPVQGRDFLYTGKIPRVGQRCETNINLHNGDWCHLSGIIVDVGPLPSFQAWAESSTFAPPTATINPSHLIIFPSHDCPYPNCHSCVVRRGAKQLSFGTFMNRAYQKDGCLNGQQLSALATLNFDFYGKAATLPFSPERTYRINYRADDSKENVWSVTSIADVTDLHHQEELPTVFRRWYQSFGGRCSSCRHIGLIPLAPPTYEEEASQSDDSSSVDEPQSRRLPNEEMLAGMYLHLCDGGLHRRSGSISGLVLDS